MASAFPEVRRLIDERRRADPFARRPLTLAIPAELYRRFHVEATASTVYSPPDPSGEGTPDQIEFMGVDVIEQAA